MRSTYDMIFGWRNWRSAHGQLACAGCGAPGCCLGRRDSGSFWLRFLKRHRAGRRTSWQPAAYTHIPTSQHCSHIRVRLVLRISNLLPSKDFDKHELLCSIVVWYIPIAEAASHAFCEPHASSCQACSVSMQPVLDWRLLGCCFANSCPLHHTVHYAPVRHKKCSFTSQSTPLRGCSRRCGGAGCLATLMCVCKLIFSPGGAKVLGLVDRGLYAGPCRPSGHPPNHRPDLAFLDFLGRQAHPLYVLQVTLNLHRAHGCAALILQLHRSSFHVPATTRH
jgi:hypothetical protein